MMLDRGQKYVINAVKVSRFYSLSKPCEMGQSGRMDNFKSIAEWREEQERIAASNDFCGLWQWLVILGCIALACY